MLLIQPERLVEILHCSVVVTFSSIGEAKVVQGLCVRFCILGIEPERLFQIHNSSIVIALA
jgi:hypothetical protein